MILIFQVQGASGHQYNPYQALYEFCQKSLGSEESGNKKPAFILTQETAQKVLNDLRHDTRGLNAASLDGSTQKELQAVETLLLAIANPEGAEFKNLSSHEREMIRSNGGLDAKEIYQQKGGKVERKELTEKISIAQYTQTNQQELAQLQENQTNQYFQHEKDTQYNPDELNRIHADFKELHFWQRQFGGTTLEQQKVSFADWKAMSKEEKENFLRNEPTKSFDDVSDKDPSFSNATLEELQEYKNARYLKAGYNAQYIREEAKKAKEKTVNQVDALTAGTYNARTRKISKMHEQLTTEYLPQSKELAKQAKEIDQKANEILESSHRDREESDNIAQEAKNYAQNLKPETATRSIDERGLLPAMEKIAGESEMKEYSFNDIHRQGELLLPQIQEAKDNLETASTPLRLAENLPPVKEKDNSTSAQALKRLKEAAAGAKETLQRATSNLDQASEDAMVGNEHRELHEDRRAIVNKTGDTALTSVQTAEKALENIENEQSTVTNPDGVKSSIQRVAAEAKKAVETAVQAGEYHITKESNPQSDQTKLEAASVTVSNTVETIQDKMVGFSDYLKAGWEAAKNIIP